MPVTNEEISVPLRQHEPPEPPNGGLLNMMGIMAASRVLWRRRGFLVRFVAACVVGGGLLAFLLPRNYESTAQIMPPANKNSITSALGSAGLNSELLGIAGMTSKTPAALYLGVLRSRTILDRLITKYDLRKVYRVSLQEYARNRLKDNTAISDDPKSGIITVVVGDRDKNRARAMAQSYAEELNALLAELDTSAAHRERVFLEERLKLANRDLDQAARDFSEFASKNATVDLRDQGRAMVSAAAELEGQLIAARSELKGLEQIYAPGNIRIRSVRARIAELEQQLAKFRGKGSGSAGTGATASRSSAPSGSTASGSPASGSADAQESELPYPSLRALPLLGVRYSELLRRTKIQEQILETLSRQYELARVQEAKELPTVALLDVPVVAERKAGMRRLFVILLIFVLAVIAGCAWVLGEDCWNAMDPQNPRKQFIKEVGEGLSSELRLLLHRRIRASDR